MLELRKRADKTGDAPGPRGWPITHVELVGDAPKEHNFADKFVSKALADGYLEFTNPRARASAVDNGVDPYDRDPVITGDQIVLHLADGDLVYDVLEAPGKYRDEGEPSGWRVSHEYRCRLAGKGK
jgi:hypothetical protein